MSCKNKRAPYLWFGALFMFLCLVMYLSPKVSDDLEFSALNLGAKELVDYVLHYGNGRVMGNLGAITMNQHCLLGVLVKSFMIASVVIMIPVFLGRTRTEDFLVSALLLLGIDSGLFSEVYSWTCGFANYIPPIWMSLLLMCVLKYYPKHTSFIMQTSLCVMVAVFGFASQFYVEHSSGVNVLLAMSMLLWSIKNPERKHIRVACVLWVCAAVIGLAMMLYVPKIFYLEGSRAEGYQTLYLNGVFEMLYSCVRNANRLANYFLGITGAIVCVCGYFAVRFGEKVRNSKLNSALYAFNFASFAHIVLISMMAVDSWYGRHAIAQHFISTVFVLIPFFVWGIAAFTMEKSSLRTKLLYLWFFAVVSIVPLLVVDPTPNRLIYQSYLFVAMAALLCISQWLQTMDVKLKKQIVSACYGLLLTLFLLIGIVFVHAHSLEELREEHIYSQMEAGAEKIEIFSIPYGYVLWDGVWCFEEAYYYNEPGDIDFDLRQLDPWGIIYLEGGVPLE